MLDLRKIPDDFKKRFDIINSITAPTQTMRVEDICHCAGISKTTFYRLFASREEFDNWYLIFVASVSIDLVGRSLTWEEGTKLNFELLSQECNYLKYTMCTWSDLDTRYMQNHRAQVLRDTLTDYRKVSIDSELEFQIVAYVAAEARMALKWLGQGMTAWSRDEMAKYLESCVPKRLHDLLM